MPVAIVVRISAILVTGLVVIIGVLEIAGVSWLSQLPVNVLLLLAALLAVGAYAYERLSVKASQTARSGRLASLERENAELASQLAQLNQMQREVEHKNRELLEQAMTDPLTGCLNRRAFMDQVQCQLTVAIDQRKPLSLLMLDLDHFKRVNDNHGHEVGDEVLRVVARVICGISRGPDAVCRFGGEEFAILLPDTGLDQCLLIAERIRSAVQASGECGTLPIPSITASVGAACRPPHGLSEISLLECADRALYQAKHAGRNRVCIFDPDCQADVNAVFLGGSAGFSDIERRRKVEDLRTQLQRMHHKQRQRS